jgi:hypothetical protein
MDDGIGKVGKAGGRIDNPYLDRRFLSSRDLFAGKIILTTILYSETLVMNTVIFYFIDNA